LVDILGKNKMTPNLLSLCSDPNMRQKLGHKFHNVFENRK
jgi:hypothetical protein